MPVVPDAPWRLLFLPPLPPEAVRQMLADLPVDLVLPEARTPASARAAAADAELIVGDWSPDLAVDAAPLAAAPRLAFVQQPSVGVDRVDVAAAAAAGVAVANTPGVNTTTVAEWCVGATFALLRQLAYADAEVRAGRWPQTGLAARGARELSGCRVGVLGMGAIGAASARRFTALGCTVSYWSRSERPAEETPWATYADLPALLAASDILLIVIALGNATRGLIDAAALARLPAGAVVVNAARGGIVDENALAEAIGAGRLGGAALDVYATEPLPADSPLRSLDRVLLSPHAAGATRESIAAVLRATVANLRRAVSGEPVRDVVNGVDPLIRRRR